jgi:transcriptional regulator with XRE-family HTH domain
MMFNGGRHHKWDREKPELGGWVQNLSRAVGDVLRDIRSERELTLRDVEARSRGYIKPSVLGGYERGERSLSLERFCEIAELYDLPPEQLLGRIMDRIHPPGRSKVVIDLTALSSLGGRDAEAMTRFVEDIKENREDAGDTVITLRSGDLRILALAARVGVSGLLRKLRPAIARTEKIEP